MPFLARTRPAPIISPVIAAGDTTAPILPSALLGCILAVPSVALALMTNPLSLEPMIITSTITEGSNGQTGMSLLHNLEPSIHTIESTEVFENTEIGQVVETFDVRVRCEQSLWLDDLHTTLPLFGLYPGAAVTLIEQTQISRAFNRTLSLTNNDLPRSNVQEVDPPTNASLPVRSFMRSYDLPTTFAFPELLRSLVENLPYSIRINETTIGSTAFASNFPGKADGERWTKGTVPMRDVTLCERLGLTLCLLLGVLMIMMCL